MSHSFEERVGAPKGWSSERVALSGYSSRPRQVNAAALLPLSSGRTLPSKWDDAERWISSPILGHQGTNVSKNSQSFRSQRRSKSQSGPLGPQLVGNCGGYSPLFMALHYGGSSMAADSPLLGSTVGNCRGEGPYPGQNEQELTCTRQWLMLLHELPAFESHDEKSDGQGEAETQMTRAGSRRDMGIDTLTPEGSSTATSSSPSPNHLSRTPSPLPAPPIAAVDAAGNRKFETEVTVKDVKVDKEDTVTRRRNHKNKNWKDGCDSFHDSDNGTTTGSRLAISISKSQREEAKINAWENLQRANAETAIRELEMKLEKKRASAMDKILKELKRAELEAEKMRSSLSKNKGSSHGICRKASQRIAGFCRRIRLSSIVNCLACGC